MLSVVFTLDASVVAFTPPTDDGPYPFLESVGTIRTSARAGSASGIGSTEPPSASITLDNTDRLVATILGNPLRAPVAIYDGDALVFSGFVSSVRAGIKMTITVES